MDDGVNIQNRPESRNIRPFPEESGGVAPSEPGLFTKEERLTLKDKAMLQLRQAILSGRLKPGSRLVEQEISDLMGISRFPLREAMAGLEKEGLVTTEPYKGWYVSKPTAVEIREIYAVRELLEVHALRRVMAAGNRAVCARLQALVDSMDVRSPRGATKFMHTDFAFHNVLCEAAGNATLHRMWLSLSVKIQLYLNMELHRESLAVLKESHRYFCSIFETGNVEAAVDEMRKHLQRGQESILGFAE
jgi:DNA-binding GntR family transcriptional regulator